jgi:tetratricopeptide (TPR) repeat protein
MRKILFVLFLACSQLLLAQNRELAQAYFEGGEYEKSLDIYLDLYDDVPSKEFYNKVVDNYLALEELKKAERFTEKHLKNLEGDPDYFWIRLGVIRRLQKDEDGAQEAFEKVLSKVDLNPGRVYPVTKVFENQQLYREALDAYERAERQNPNLNFHYQKAQLYGELGDIESVFSELLILIDKFPAYLQNIRSILSQSLSDDPNNPTNAFLKEQILIRIQESNNPVFTELLIWVFIQEGNFKGAFRQLKSLDMRQDRQQRELFDFASSCMLNKEYEVAEETYSYIIGVGNVSPVFVPSHVGLLEAMRLKLFSKVFVPKEEVQALSLEYSSRLSKLEKTIAVAPAYREWYRLMAFQLGDTSLAMSGLESLKNIPDPSRQELDETLLTLADVLTFSGKYFEAILYYAQVEKARPGTDLADRAKFNRARVAFYQGDFDWAENLFEALKFSVSKRIANDAMEYSILIRDNTGLDTNTEALSFYAKAELLHFRQKYTEALKVLDTLEIGFYGHSLQDELLWTRAEIALKIDDRPLAKKSLKQLLDEYGDDILADNALILLGTLLEEEGKSDEAKDLYEQLLRDHPDSFFTSEARQRIRVIRGDLPM